MSLALLSGACSPKVATRISSNYQALDYREEVHVLNVQAIPPEAAEVLGTVKIGDTGFSTDCGFETVLEKAKDEARKVGGNVIKLTKHIPPSIWGSSCHRITAVILKVDNFDVSAYSDELVEVAEVIDSTLFDEGCALLHVYRHSGQGALISYDLHLGDTVICRVSNKWKQTIKIKKDGLNTLWARTESKAEIPINIEFGKEYYIRCRVTMGAFVGRPRLELVDNRTGKIEYESIQKK